MMMIVIIYLRTWWRCSRALAEQLIAEAGRLDSCSNPLAHHAREILQNLQKILRKNGVDSPKHGKRFESFRKVTIKKFDGRKKHPVGFYLQRSDNLFISSW